MNEEHIRELITEIFRLPKKCDIDIQESDVSHDDHPGHHSMDQVTGSGTHTEITIHISSTPSQYIIPKKIDQVTRQDIQDMQDSLKELAYTTHPVLARITRLFGWWVIFAGSFSIFSICPVCGQVGCPVGLGITGILAGFLSFLKMYLKDIIASLKEALAKFFP